LQPAWQDASPLPSKFPKAKEEEAPTAKPRGSISLFSKVLADQYKKLDPLAERTTLADTQYQAMRVQLEADVRSQLKDLVSYMIAPEKGAPSNGYELNPKHRDTSEKDGQAQQEAFFRRLSGALNDGSICDLENVKHPEVLVHDPVLTDTLKQAFPEEFRLEKNRQLRAGQTSVEAEKLALAKIITDLENGKLNNPDAEDSLIEAQDRATERASHWIGLPVPSGSLLDQIGCDYLLINKHTGEYYPIDVTLKGLNRTDRLVECQAQNSNLEFKPVAIAGDKHGKSVPSDRTPWVMSVVDELTWENTLFQIQQKTKASQKVVKDALEEETKNRTAIAVAAMLQTPSGLNLYDHPLPQMNTGLNRQARLKELDMYVPILKNAGKIDWAKDIDTRVRTYVKKNP
jgi:hypothetical protein